MSAKQRREEIKNMLASERLESIANINCDHIFPTKGLESFGVKLDTGKQQWFAMPLEVLELLADVFTAGEKKYEIFNNLKPFENGDRRFFDATMRHLVECQRNALAIDEETGCYHGMQAAWNLIMRTYHAHKKAQDEASKI